MHTTDSCAAEHEAPKGGLERWRTVGGTRQRGFWVWYPWKGECHVLDHEVSGTDGAGTGTYTICSGTLLPPTDRKLCNTGGKS